MAKFPPQPTYPLAIDSDQTLFLVYNTSEAKTLVDNSAWSEEIEIIPVESNQNEIWAENGFANISGELFYYDSVEKNPDGKIYKFKNCARNIGGKKTKFNPSGTWVRGFVIAEHHNQLVDVTISIENYLLDLEDEIIKLEEQPFCLDDIKCPEVILETSFQEQQNNCEGITLNYTITINGAYNNFRLDFGDGEFTTSPSNGIHTYAPNSNVDPIVTISNEQCTVVQTPIERNNSEIPEETIAETNFEIVLPSPVAFPDIEIPDCPTIPLDFDLPQLIIPQINLTNTIPNIAINIPNIPSQINIVPPIQIPEQVTFGPAPFIPVDINFGDVPNIPTDINFSEVDIPNIINFGPVDIPSVINFSGDVNFGDAPEVDYNATIVFGDAPIADYNATIDFGPAPLIEFGPAPSFPTTITFGDAPSFPTTITFGPAPSFPTTINFGDAPDIPDINFGDAPDIPDINFGPAPDIPDIGFDDPPTIPDITITPYNIPDVTITPYNIPDVTITPYTIPDVTITPYTIPDVQFGPVPYIPSYIYFGPAPYIPNKINFGDAPYIPNEINFGDAPYIPNEINFGDAPYIPNEINFGDAPHIPNEINFGDAPHIPNEINFGDAPHIPNEINFGDLPPFPDIEFGTPPDIPDIGFDTPPSFPDIGFESPPDIPDIGINWGNPPTITVEISCPSSGSPASFARRDYFENEDFEDDFSDIKLEINNEDIGIPSEIKIVAPKEFPQIEITHNLPDSIPIISNLPERIELFQESPILHEINIVGSYSIPKTIEIVSQNIPKSILLDSSNLPSSISLEVPEISPIKLDASEIPDSIKVVGIPDSIELKIPDEIIAKLEIPDNLEVPLVYKGGPIPIQFDNTNLGNGDGPCFTLVPCDPKK